MVRTYRAQPQQDPCLVGMVVKAALALLSIASCAYAFVPPNVVGPLAGSTIPSAGLARVRGSLPRQLRSREALRPSGRPSLLAMSTVPKTVVVPSWEQINELAGPEPTRPTPVLTLYRDNNGWCPFCEKVWISLMAKGIPFSEDHIALVKRDERPQWYRNKVPTGRVPAIEFAGSDEVLWESRDILMLLEDDERFKDYTPSLLPASERERAMSLLDEVSPTVGLRWAVQPTGEETETVTEALVKNLDRVEGLLGESTSPFFLSSGFSIVDCEALPDFERVAVQAPLKLGLTVRDPQRWPNINTWLTAAEESIPGYRERVRGDVYSWASKMAHVGNTPFWPLGEGGGTDVRGALDEASAELERQLAAAPASFPPAPRLEAARKLLANHEAVVRDATSEAKSQQWVGRLGEGDRECVDRALRRAAVLLLAEDSEGLSLEGVTPAEVKGARLVATRLCSPRDMGAPAAAALRASLGSIVHAES